MANIGPVISSFWTDVNMNSYLRLDGVVCVVDCMNILTYLASEDINFEVKQQICYSDRILVNKCDLVTRQKVKTTDYMIYTKDITTYFSD